MFDFAHDAIRQFVQGEITLNQANDALKEAKAGFHIAVDYELLTEDEMWVSSVGHFPEQATGWGLLDRGAGILEKVRVRQGCIVGVYCEAPAWCIIAERTYRVYGNRLDEYDFDDVEQPIWKRLKK